MKIKLSTILNFMKGLGIFQMLAGVGMCMLIYMWIGSVLPLGRAIILMIVSLAGHTLLVTGYATVKAMDTATHDNRIIANSLAKSASEFPSIVITDDEGVPLKEETEQNQ